MFLKITLGYFQHFYKKVAGIHLLTVLMFLKFLSGKAMQSTRKVRYRILVFL